jgi:branched-subunit amino acid transport protein
MSVRADVLLAILLLGIASYTCRAGGFFLMRYVALTPPVEAWLRAIPIALVGASSARSRSMAGRPSGSASRRHRPDALDRQRIS